MRALWLLVALLTLGAPTASIAEGKARILALRKPTIVILVAPAAEQKKYKDDSEYNEFSGDFAVYANRMIAILRDHSEVKVQWSDADTVSFPGTGFKPVRRRQLETEWGYVFFRPGAPPIVQAGVADDEFLVCIAVRLYKLKIDGYKCEASYLSPAGSTSSKNADVEQAGRDDTGEA